MSGVAKELRDSIAKCLSSEAGPEYKELKYLLELEQNSFTGGQDKRFGVRPGAAPRNDVASVNKAITYTQTFQFVLTKGHKVTGVSDTEKYDAYLDLHDIALRFNSKVLRTKAGLPSRVLNAINFEIEEPQFLDDKVVVLIGNIDIIYRLAF